MPAFNPYQVAGTDIFGPSNYNSYPLAGTQIFGPLQKPPVAATPAATAPSYGPFRGYNFLDPTPASAVATPPTFSAAPTPTIPTAPAATATSPAPFQGYNLPNVTPGTVTMPQVGGPEEVAKAVSVADIVNKYNQNNLQGQYQAFNPNLQGNLATSSANTASLLQGQIPADVVNQTAQLNAERTGARGIDQSSPAANAALMRLYGVTSLDLQKQGEQQLTGAIARTPIAQPFDISSQLTTPAQRLDASVRMQIAELQAKTGLQEAQIQAAVAFANQANQMGIAKLDNLTRQQIAQLEAQTGLTETQMRIAAEYQNAQLQARVAESGQRNNWNIAVMEADLGMRKTQIQAALQWQGDLLQASTAANAQQGEWNRSLLAAQTSRQNALTQSNAALEEAAMRYGYGAYGGEDIPVFPMGSPSQPAFQGYTAFEASGSPRGLV